ncbi:hypothetical protein V6N13_064163 [Hibiscus sabdariffa]
MGSFVDPLLDPSGRPPDPLIQLESLIVLERPGSPTALKDQRNSKKSRGSGTEQGEIVIDAEDMVMDTEVAVVSDGSRESDLKDNGGAPQQGVPAIGKNSYASVVSQGRGRHASGMGEDVLDPNSVIVLDEDCVISESGDYPSINLNKVSNDDAIAMEVNNHSSDRTSNKSELYGPWMVVKDRRRQPVFSKSSGRTLADVGGEANGSRFAVLNKAHNGDRMVVDGVVTDQDINVHLAQSELCATENGASVGVKDAQVGGTGSAAYRSSSPGRRSKVTGNMIPMDSPLDVIPLVGGSSVAISSHAIHNTPGSHRAISIQETSGKDKGARFDDRHVGRGKGIRDVNPRGVRIRKTVRVSSPNRVLLSDWVQTTSQQIESEADSNRGERVGGGIMGEDGREAISIQQATRSDASVLGDTNVKNKGGGSGDLPL